MAERPVVFISYSHDSEEHVERVLKLAELLRRSGLDVRLDRYLDASPVQGWSRWTLDQLIEASFVLVVCSEIYYRQFRNQTAFHSSEGASWESIAVVHEMLRRAAHRDGPQTFIPVVLRDREKEFVPESLRFHGLYALRSNNKTREFGRFLLEKHLRMNEVLSVRMSRPIRDLSASDRELLDNLTATRRVAREPFYYERAHSMDDPRPKPGDVYLSTAAPSSVPRNSTFVARFSAYAGKYRNQVVNAITAEAPDTKLHLDLHACQWEPGTKVTVSLSADHLHVEEPRQTFVWNGKWAILRFDVAVPDSVEGPSAVLRFDVAIEGLTIARLRPEIKIGTTSQERQLATMAAPKKAFASYASEDRREVLGRIRSLQIFTGIDVFLDCLAIRPGDRWKDRIMDEIRNRDIFWLFWSSQARQSPWVEWEWRTALSLRNLGYIQPHPLEGPDTAPPPEELAALQFGTLYETFLSQMKSSWWDCRIVQCRRIARRAVAASYWLLVPILLGLIYAVWWR